MSDFQAYCTLAERRGGCGLLHRVWGLLRWYHIPTAETLLVLLGAGSGVWLLLPGDIIKAHPGLWPLLSWGSDTAWGVAALLIASVRLAGLLAERRTLRMAGAFCGFMFWLAVTLTLVLGGESIMSLPIYAVMSLTNFSILSRLARREGD